MSYFITATPIKMAQPFELKGEEASHILQSRRIKKGEILEVQDHDDQRFLCEVATIGRKSLELLPLEELSPPPEPELEVILYQALVKEKALDFIIQKTCELGVKEVRFFESNNALQKSKLGDLDKKLARWQKIALEAAKQSGRLRPAKISLVGSLPEDLPSTNTLVFDTSGARKSIKELERPKGPIHLVLGPEGGLSEGELPSHYPTFHIGPRVLRADTAAITVVAILQFYLGDLA